MKDHYKTVNKGWTNEIKVKKSFFLSQVLGVEIATHEFNKRREKVNKKKKS